MYIGKSVERNMETVNEKNAEIARRKKRVESLKRGIIIAVVCSILIPIVMCICLLFKVNSMQKQIDTLYLMKLEKKQMEMVASQSEELEQSQAELLVDELPQTSEASEEEQNQKERVYLTFDDGPSSNTEAILDVLEECNVKASFFVVGKEDDASMEMYRRIVEDGHTLGMHSFSHQYSTIYQSVESFSQDLENLQSLLKSATGKEVTLYRFPGGSSNKVSNIGMEEFIRYLKEKDIVYYDWNVSSGDATSQELEPEEIVQNVLSDVKLYKNSVVLMHDGANKENTVRALPEMIEKLREMDVELLPITDETNPIQHLKAEDVN